MVVCTLCNRSFKSKNSLRSHKSRFHKQNDGSTDEFEDKSVEKQEDESSSRLQSDKKRSHSAFGYDISKYSQGERADKRFCSDDEMSNESHRKHIEDNFQNSKDLLDQNVDFEMISKLNKRLELAEKQSISPKLMKYIVRLPKLFKMVTYNLEDIEGLEDNVERLKNNKEKSKPLNQIGFGEDKKKIKDFSKDIKRLFDDVSEIKEFMKSRKYTDMENIEKMLDNCLLIKHLFGINNFDDLHFKTKELCNAAFMLSKGILERNLTKEEQDLVEKLSKASQFQAKDLLDNNYSILKSIFADMPNYEDTKSVVEELRQEYSNEGPTTQWSINTDAKNKEDEEYQPIIETVQNGEEYSGADETSDEEWNVDQEPESGKNIDTEESSYEE